MEDTLPKVKIAIPEGISDDEVAKALEHSLELLKGKKKQSDPFSELKKLNPAGRRIAKHFDDRYEMMVSSLVKEVKKVFEE